MKKLLQAMASITVLVLVAGLFSTSWAVTNSNAPTITLTATVSTSLTVALSATAETFTVVPGTAANAGNAPITVTTTWQLPSGTTAVKLYAYFNSAAAALVGAASGTNVASSIIEIGANGGALAPVNQTIAGLGFGTAGATLLLANHVVTAANLINSVGAADVLTFNFNATTVPQLPADTYNGTLNIRAQATP